MLLNCTFSLCKLGLILQTDRSPGTWVFMCIMFVFIVLYLFKESSSRLTRCASCWAACPCGRPAWSSAQCHDCSWGRPSGVARPALVHWWLGSGPPGEGGITINSQCVFSLSLFSLYHYLKCLLSDSDSKREESWRWCCVVSVMVDKYNHSYRPWEIDKRHLEVTSVCFILPPRFTSQYTM